MLDLKELWEKHEGAEFLKFERVKNRLSQRPDIHAFILLDQIAPPKPTRGSPDHSSDMVGSAEHDEVWLDTDLGDLASNATEEQIIDLIRCGVRFDEDVDSLAMFV